jgi:DNA-binding CsgD family transcriptional regulator
MARPLQQSSRTGRAADAGPLRSLESALNGSLDRSAESSAVDDGGQSPSRPLLTAPLRQVSTGSDQLATPRDVMVALTYGLELVRCGAMLVAFEGKPHLANRAALAILEKGDGLSMSRSGLIADRASDTRLLQHLLHEAITYPEKGEPQGSPLALPRKKAHTSLIVRVVPGPGLDCWPGTDNRAALLTLYDEDKGLQVDESVLSKLYGLTRGEAALAAILIQGKSIEEAAGQLFISPHTARTHLKRIFMKTDTHRQTELVVRMFSAIF